MRHAKNGRIVELSASGITVSGEVITMPESGDPTDFICQECLMDTAKALTAEIIQYGVIDDIHWATVRCERCGKLHVVQYVLEHWAYGVID